MSMLCSIHQLSLIYPEKICFESFSSSIYAHQKIAVIGDNGCGKTSLLKMVAGLLQPKDGYLEYASHFEIGYVPQLSSTSADLSGAQCFQKALSEALSTQPELLILDEPTNHLDADNRKNLMQFLKYYPGAVLVASHDVRFLSQVPDCLWAVSQGQIEVFNGQYHDFIREKGIQETQLNQQLSSLEKEKKAAHQKLMKEQQRSKKSKEAGKKSIDNRKWPTIVSHAKMHRASNTSGQKSKHIRAKREEVLSKIAALNQSEMITPQFHLQAGNFSQKSVVMIKDGTMRYIDKKIDQQINLQLFGQERLAIMGQNGSGKSTLVKALLNDPVVIKEGEWIAPHIKDIGYLDQLYANLSSTKTVYSTIESVRPDWSHQQIRTHLNDFLFKSNLVIHQETQSLSGGEKARLSLAQIAAKPPKLLILDEMTNNLDLTTRAYVIQCLKDYPGPMMVISHDEDFLEHIQIDSYYVLA